MILALVADRAAPAELRARLAYDEPTQRALLENERPGVGELAILCTCHRTEVYFTSSGAASEAVHGVAGILPGLQPTDQHDLTVLEGLDAIEHLFRVACGLDSMVVGEPQVLGQVRRAYVLARDVGSTGPALANIFGRAMRLGKRVRAETELGTVGHSIGSIAAEHLHQRLGGLAGRTGTIVGAGEAAADAAARLWTRGARLAIVSRQRASAAKLAEQVNGTAFALSELSEVLAKSDFAVLAVSGGIVVRPRHIPVRDPENPFVMLDLSVPRAADIDGRPDVELRSLEEIPGPHTPALDGGSAAAEEMVAAEMVRIERWLETRASGPAIQTLRERADAVVADEVARAVSGLDLPDQARQRIDALGMRIAKKLLHGPTAALREADAETRATIMRIFGLE
ncbi:MAG: glutamyl-tRNA reductase [Actinomycetota bacterium]